MATKFQHYSLPEVEVEVEGGTLILFHSGTPAMTFSAGDVKALKSVLGAAERFALKGNTSKVKVVGKPRDKGTNPVAKK
jgi:hypothetical protein